MSSADFAEETNSSRYSIYHPWNGSTCIQNSSPSVTI